MTAEGDGGSPPPIPVQPSCSPGNAPRSRRSSEEPGQLLAFRKSPNTSADARSAPSSSKINTFGGLAEQRPDPVHSEWRLLVTRSFASTPGRRADRLLRSWFSSSGSSRNAPWSRRSSDTGRAASRLSRPHSRSTPPCAPAPAPRSARRTTAPSGLPRRRRRRAR